MKFTKEQINKIILEELEGIQEELGSRPKPHEVLEAFEEFQKYLNRDRAENQKKFGDELYMASGTKTSGMRVLGMLQALAGDADHIPYKEAMFQGNKRIDPSSMSSGDMGPVQPIIDAHIRLGSMLRQSLEADKKAADLFNEINVMLGELADSLD